MQHFSARLLAAPTRDSTPASSSLRPTYPAGSRKHIHNAAGRPRELSHAASSLKTYMNSASRLVDVTPFTPHLQDERRRAAAGGEARVIPNLGTVS